MSEVLNRSTDEWLRTLFSFDVKPVQQPVRERGNHERGNADKRQARKQSVERSEKFCRVRMERIDRAHAAQTHGRIQKRIDPGEASEEVRSENAKAQSDGDQKQCQLRTTPAAA